MVLKHLKKTVGKRSDTAEPQQFMVGKSKVDIGRFTYGTKRMEVIEWGEGANLRVGSFCSVASGLRVLLGGNHRADWVSTFPFGFIHTDVFGAERKPEQPYSNGDVQIGHDVWIGSNVTIMSGVTIGNGAILAANATVVKDVGPYEIWGGNPAQFIKKRFEDDVIRALQDLAWWDLPLAKIKSMAPLLSDKPDMAELHAMKNMP